MTVVFFTTLTIIIKLILLTCTPQLVCFSKIIIIIIIIIIIMGVAHAYLLSQLKRASSGIICMLSAFIMIISMV